MTMLESEICPGCGQFWTPTDPDAEVWLCDTCKRAQYGGDERHETLRLFAPAPNVIPGQLGL